MIRMTVRLEEIERDAIWKLAQNERRDPRDQAAILVREALRGRGLLSRVEDAPEETNEDAVRSDPDRPG